MNDLTLDDAIDLLTTETPSYVTLLSVYYELQTHREGSPERLVARTAITQVVGEIIEYLDYVSDDLEKSIGLTREAERERVLAALEAPSGDTVIERASALITQWDDLETYTATGPAGITSA